MLFSANNLTEVKDFLTYSNEFSKMLGLPPKSGIIPIQNQDRLEEWGVAINNRVVSYGRHLSCASKTSGAIPFWTGLAITQAGSVEIAVVFDKKLMDSLNKTQAFQNFTWTHAVIPSHCNLNSPNTVFVEIDLAPAELARFRRTPDPHILADFLDEVLGIL